ncbi:MAG: protein translocase subunit SecD [SAR86 cluster bacterium]|nr:protein translocase subunit SecD [SAR86 cluster bacterium]MDG1721714.1 protein translocase subunit SecD [SAR86 cluster bacterium]
MNRFSPLKYTLITLVLALGILYALPNLYPAQPAIQVAYTDSGKSADQSLLETVSESLKSKSIDFDDVFLRDNNIVAKFFSIEDQLSAKTVLQRALLDKAIIALNLEPSTPQWLKDIGGRPLKLGLDLSGGVHFLLEVDIESALNSRLEAQLNSYRKTFRDQKIYLNDSSSRAMTMIFEFKDSEGFSSASGILRKDNIIGINGALYDINENADRNLISVAYTDASIKEIRDYAVGQNLTTLRNRVNELGVSEPVVQRQGSSRIVVQLPGVQDPTAAKKIIGKTANLEFRLEAKQNASRLRKEEFEFKDSFRTAYLEKNIVVTGDRVTNASTGFDENGRSQVNITLDMQGGRSMQRATGPNIGRGLAVLFVEQKSKSEIGNDIEGNEIIIQTSYIEKKIISLATIQANLGNSFRITGVGSPQEASELALLLRAGALAAPMKFVEERTVGPSLGKENIETGFRSVVIGFMLVVLFMALYYGMFGIAANVALFSNLILITGIMSLLGAALSLPGIAGIVLTVGMAVDANVLIFSRIREELKTKDPQSAINDGFSRAFVTIFDANVTTLIASLVLYTIGTGPVKGFAITLSIGIVTSMFTAILVTRSIVNLIYGGKNIKELKV